MIFLSTTGDVLDDAQQAAGPIWLRLTKTGSTYKGEVSFDGQGWQAMGGPSPTP